MHAACPENLVGVLLEVTLPVALSVGRCHAVLIKCIVCMHILNSWCSAFPVLSMQQSFASLTR